MISCVVYIQYQKSRRYRLQFKSLNTSLLWSQYIFLLQASLGKARQNDKKKPTSWLADNERWRLCSLLTCPGFQKVNIAFSERGKKSLSHTVLFLLHNIEVVCDIFLLGFMIILTKGQKHVYLYCFHWCREWTFISFIRKVNWAWH